MGRDGDDMDLLALESMHFLEFIDKGAVVDILDIGGELQYGHLADHSDVEETVIGNSIGHHHHATAVEAAVADGKTQNVVVKTILSSTVTCTWVILYLNRHLTTLIR